MRTGTEDKITLALIRHGETRSNKEHRYLGKTDEGLSEEGRKELRRHGRQLEKDGQHGTYPRVDMLFSGPMCRCRETAAILYPDIAPVIIEEWTETDFGIFEGKNYEELKDDRQYQAWIDSGGRMAFPEGESREAFICRCIKGFGRVQETLREEKKRTGHFPGTVGLVVHGGTIMALLCTYLGGDYFDYRTANGEVYLCRLTESEGDFRWEDWNTI